MQKNYICGEPSSLAIEIKVLNVEEHEFSDCVYRLVINNNSYGVYDENFLVSHNFIECNLLITTIEHAIKVFRDKQNIIDLTGVIDSISVEDALAQIIRYHYCFGLKDEIEMNYEQSMDIFINKVTKNKDDFNISTFIMSDHDSMKGYFIIPFFMHDKLYLALIKKDCSDYEDFDCSDGYNWGFGDFDYFHIDMGYLLEIFICAKKFLQRVLSHRTNG